MKLQTLRERRARIAAGQTSHEAELAQALEAAATPALAGTFTRLYPQAALQAARHADAMAAAVCNTGALPVPEGTVGTAGAAVTGASATAGKIAVCC